MNNIVFFISIGIIIYDIVLAIQKKATISEWCQALFPSTVDWIIGLVGVVVLCILHDIFPEFDAKLLIGWSGAWGHIWLPNRERYIDG